MTRVTQEKIAEATGLSQATVSTILSGRHSVRLSESTRRRVLDTAQRLGYHRLPEEHSASRNIGLLVTEAAEQALRHEYYSTIYRGLEEAFWENDYHLIFSSLRDRLDQDGAVPKCVRGGRVAGLVLLAATQATPALADTGLPIVSAGRFIGLPGVDSVYPDNGFAGRLAAEHLLGLGHRAFLMLAGQARDLNLTERADAFGRTVQAGGGKIVATLTVEEEPADLNAATILRAYLASHGRDFTTIAAMSDRLASGALAALRAKGIAVPAAVSVVGCLGLATAEQQDPPLTSIHVPAEGIGRIAARRLLDRLQCPEQLSGLRIMVPVELVVRQSTAPPRE